MIIIQKKKTRKELYDIIKKNPAGFYTHLRYYDKNGRYWTTRYDVGKALSKKTKKELQDDYNKAKRKNFKMSTKRVNMSVSKYN